MLHLGTVTLSALMVRSCVATEGASWPAQEVIEGKPIAQFMGLTSRPLSVGLYLHVEFCVPAQVLEQLRGLLGPDPFEVWLDSGEHKGTYVLTDIQPRPQWMLPTGEVLAMTVDLSLTEPGEEFVTDMVTAPALTNNTTELSAEPEQEGYEEVPDVIDLDAMDPEYVVRS